MESGTSLLQSLQPATDPCLSHINPIHNSKLIGKRSILKLSSHRSTGVPSGLAISVLQPKLCTHSSPLKIRPSHPPSIDQLMFYENKL